MLIANRRYAEAIRGEGYAGTEPTRSSILALEAKRRIIHQPVSTGTVFFCLWSASTLAGDSLALAVSGNAVTRPPANPLAIQSLEQMSATHNRPLFSSTRRPPPVAAAPPAQEPEAPPPPQPPAVTLFGTVSDAQGRQAIVLAPTDNIVRVRIGDEIEGWKVAAIEARQVVLSLADRSATFAMFKARGPDQSTKTAAVSKPGKPQLNRTR